MSLQKTQEETKTYKKVCPICKKKFKTTRHNKIYCSAECTLIANNNAHKKAMKKYTDKKISERKEINQNTVKVCPICNKEFTPLDSHQKYCSDECKKEGGRIVQKQSRQNRKEQVREYLKKRYHEIYKDKLKAKRKEATQSMVKVCPICNKEFNPSHASQKYCSEECVEKAKTLNNLAFCKTEKYKKAHEKYLKSKKGIASRKKYQNTQAFKDSVKKSYEKHKEERLQYAKEYRESHKEENLQYAKEYYKKHKEERLQYIKEYREKKKAEKETLI